MDIEEELEALREDIETHESLLQLDHFLTWVYFIAAAASPNEDIGRYFSRKLYRHTMTFGWKNVGMMLKLLEVVKATNSCWCAQLQEHHDFLCA